MAEYIEREAAVSELMPIYKSASLRNRNVFSTARKCLESIEAIPAADVVEVVRRGECMFWDAPPSCEGLARCRTGESGVRFRKAYDFCSRGRKKMDGGVDNDDN